MAAPLGALASMGGGMSGGAGGSAGSTASSNSGFDNSGWSVNFGSGSIDAGGAGQYMPYVLAAAAVLIVWRMTKKR